MGMFLLAVEDRGREAGCKEFQLLPPAIDKERFAREKFYPGHVLQSVGPLRLVFVGHLVAGYAQFLPFLEGRVATLEYLRGIEVYGHVGHQVLEVGRQAFKSVLDDAEADRHDGAHVDPGEALFEVVVLVGVGDAPRQELGFDGAGLQSLVALGHWHGDGGSARALESLGVVGAHGCELDAVEVLEGDDGILIR